MKNTLLLIIITMVLLLSGCSGSNLPQKNDTPTDTLSKSFESILSTDSLSYISNDEQILNTNTDITTTITTSEIKRIKEPFTVWSKVKKIVSHTNAQEKTEAVTEAYQNANKDGLELFYRGKDTEWQKSTIDNKVQAKKFIDHSIDSIKAAHYILDANLDSFIMNGQQDGLLKYSGSISQSSVVEAYKLYIRDFYIDGGLIKSDKELSNDDILKEITSGEIYELMVGIPSLAFSDQPVPITIWISEKDNTIAKVEIDKIKVTQALVDTMSSKTKDDVPSVEKSVVTYKVLEINTLNEITLPQ